MKILVTGAAGFIGSHLAERLAFLSHEVTGLDSFTDYYSPKLKMRNAESLNSNGVNMLKLDLATSALNEQEVNDYEVVFHLAAQPGNSENTDFTKYVTNNIVATHRLLGILKNSKTLKLFVNISTSSVYGFHAKDAEDAAPKPTSYYGVTKLASEQLALSYARNADFPATSVRLFSVYGERERPDKLYPILIRSMLSDQPFPLREGSDSHFRSFTYVQDAVDGLIKMLEHSEVVKGEIFNIGSEERISTIQGIEIVEKILNRKARIQITSCRLGDQVDTRANINKAKAMLGYAPQIGPEEGLEREVIWIKNNLDAYM